MSLSVRIRRNNFIIKECSGMSRYEEELHWTRFCMSFQTGENRVHVDANCVKMTSAGAYVTACKIKIALAI